ncbi:DUF3630 family protein [Psychroserpens sp. XS_ASV72]|uniref:DUF3630 family protein n=1 Tax=Psychroserpens sp. XS_ASV72 TaxID=3241293 RepID=UPI003512F6A3
MKSQKTYNLQITKSPDSKIFSQVADFIIEKLNGKITEQVDGIEQKYWDFKIDKILITLHSEHYLGISVYGQESEQVEYLLERINSELNLIK